MSNPRKIDVEVALDVFEKYGIDHGAAAAVAVHIGRAMRAYRSMTRLRLQVLRAAKARPTCTDTEVRYDTEAVAARPYLEAGELSWRMADALALAYVPTPLINEVRTVGRPSDGSPGADDCDSPLGVAFRVIDSTLGNEWALSMTRVANGMGSILLRTGIDANKLFMVNGFMLGAVKGLATAASQRRRLKDADTHMIWTPNPMGQYLIQHETFLCVVVMAAAMGELN